MCDVLRHGLSAVYTVIPHKMAQVGNYKFIG